MFSGILVACCPVLYVVGLQLTLDLLWILCGPSLLVGVLGVVCAKTLHHSESQFQLALPIANTRTHISSHHTLRHANNNIDKPPVAILLSLLCVCSMWSLLSAPAAMGCVRTCKEDLIKMDIVKKVPCVHSLTTWFHDHTSWTDIRMP